MASSRFPLYILVTILSLALAGCAVPLLGENAHDNCRSINGIVPGLCHDVGTVGGAVASAARLGECGSWILQREGRSAPNDWSCRNPGIPQPQRSGLVWNPAVDPVQRRQVELEQANIREMLAWCRGQESAQCELERRLYLSGQYRASGITGKEGWE